MFCLPRSHVLGFLTINWNFWNHEVSADHFSTSKLKIPIMWPICLLPAVKWPHRARIFLVLYVNHAVDKNKLDLKNKNEVCKYCSLRFNLSYQGPGKAENKKTWTLLLQQNIPPNVFLTSTPISSSHKFTASSTPLASCFSASFSFSWLAADKGKNKKSQTSSKNRKIQLVKKDFMFCFLTVLHGQDYMSTIVGNFAWSLKPCSRARVGPPRLLLRFGGFVRSHAIHSPDVFFCLVGNTLFIQSSFLSQWVAIKSS